MMARVQAALDELVTLLALEPIEVNIFRGRSPDENRQRVFGGQVAGQALVAAARTVDDPARLVHSLHAYFLRPGDPTVPILYEVDRLRDGRSFTTRRVVAIQHGRAIFNLQASFHAARGGPRPPDARCRPGCPTRSRCPTGTTRMAPYKDQLGDWYDRPRPIDLRYVDGDPMSRKGTPSDSQRVWLRADGQLPDDPVVHACIVTYASDMTLLDTTVLPFGLAWDSPGMQMASLDHAMWFHRPFRADEWLLYDQHALVHRRRPRPGRRGDLRQRRPPRRQRRPGGPGEGRPVSRRRRRSSPPPSAPCSPSPSCGGDDDDVDGDDGAADGAGRRQRRRRPSPTATAAPPTGAAATTAPPPATDHAPTPRPRRRPSPRRPRPATAPGPGAEPAVTFAEVGHAAQPRRPGLAGRRRRAVRRRAGRARSCASPTSRSDDRARHHRPHRGRRRAGAARPGVRPDRRRWPTSTTPTTTATRRSASTRSTPTARSATGDEARVVLDDRAAVRQPQRRRPRVRPRRAAVHRHGRRRRGRRPRAAGHRPGDAARQDAAHRPDAGRRPAVHGAGRQPVRRRRPARRRRSGRAGCATRGGSRSTARPATCGSPTSARTPSRRSTSPRRPTASTPARALSFGWSAFEGDEPLQRRRPRRRRTRRRSRTYAHDDGRCSISGGVRARGGDVPELDRLVRVRRLLPARCGRSRSSARARR